MGASGYLTLIYYSTIEDMFGSPFASIGINEMFGSFTADTSNNWMLPQPGVLEAYSGTFYDQVSASCASLPCSAIPLPLPPQGLNNPVMHATRRTSHKPAMPP